MKLAILHLFYLASYSAVEASCGNNDSYWRQKLPLLLRQSLPSSSQPLDFRCRSLLTRTKYFASNIMALDVNIRKQHSRFEEIHLVYKTLKTKTRKPLEAAIDAFRRELNIYESVVPALSAFQKSTNFSARSFASLVPKFYGGQYYESDVDKGMILLDNLEYGKYATINRITPGLNKRELFRVIEYIANIHASAIAFKSYNSKKFSNIFSNLTSLESGHRFNSSIEFFQKMQNYFKEDLKNARSYSVFEFESLNNVPEWKTLVHGDLRPNNVMVKKLIKGRKVDFDIKLLNFGSSYYGCGLIDVAFILFVCPDSETLSNHFEESRDYYYDTFVKNLKMYNLDVKNYEKGKFNELLKITTEMYFSEIVSRILPNKRGKVKHKYDVNSVEVEKIYQIILKYSKM